MACKITSLALHAFGIQTPYGLTGKVPAYAGNKKIPQGLKVPNEWCFSKKSGPWRFSLSCTKKLSSQSRLFHGHGLQPLLKNRQPIVKPVGNLAWLHFTWHFLRSVFMKEMRSKACCDMHVGSLRQIKIELTERFDQDCKNKSCAADSVLVHPQIHS